MAMPVPRSVQWLTQTKIGPPLLRADYVARSRLALCSAISRHPLTLISAPAGYGKTTLLAGLPEACPDLPLAWLSLDEQDNDPVGFLVAVIQSLQRLKPGFGAIATGLLQTGLDSGSPSSAPEGARRLAGVMINEVLESFPAPFILILDDLHLIDEPAIYAALDYLIERMPPQS